MLAVTASRTCAVQMFEVAFSRRMCCSRVCSAKRKPGVPSRSLETPTSRPGKRAFQPGADGDEARVRSAVEQRYAEPLAGPDSDVGTPLPRRRRQRQGHQVAGRDHHGAAGVRTIRDRPQLLGAGEPTAGAGGLHEHGEQVDLLDRLGQRLAGHDDLDPQRSGPGGHDADASAARCRRRAGSPDRFDAAPSQRHCLGGGGRLVEQARSCRGQRR